jgi:hypothetical protein
MRPSPAAPGGFPLFICPQTRTCAHTERERKKDDRGSRYNVMAAIALAASEHATYHCLDSTALHCTDGGMGPLITLVAVAHGCGILGLPLEEVHVAGSVAVFVYVYTNFRK